MKNLQLTINLTVSFPENGGEPMVGIESDHIISTTNPPEMMNVINIPSESEQDKPAKYKHWRTKACINCAKDFKYFRSTQKFDTKQCAGEYRRKQQRMLQDEYSEAQAISKSFMEDSQVHSVPLRKADHRTSGITGDDYRPITSSDPFYKAQLKKAAERDSFTYNRYLPKSSRVLSDSDS